MRGARERAARADERLRGELLMAASLARARRLPDWGKFVTRQAARRAAARQSRTELQVMFDILAARWRGPRETGGE